MKLVESAADPITSHIYIYIYIHWNVAILRATSSTWFSGAWPGRTGHVWGTVLATFGAHGPHEYGAAHLRIWIRSPGYCPLLKRRLAIAPFQFCLGISASRLCHRPLCLTALPPAPYIYIYMVCFLSMFLSLKLKSVFEDCTWSLYLKSVVEVCIWSLYLKSAFEVCIWSLALKDGGKEVGGRKEAGADLKQKTTHTGSGITIVMLNAPFP